MNECQNHDHYHENYVGNCGPECQESLAEMLTKLSQQQATQIEAMLAMLQPVRLFGFGCGFCEFVGKYATEELLFASEELHTKTEHPEEWERINSVRYESTPDLPEEFK